MNRIMFVASLLIALAITVTGQTSINIIGRTGVTSGGDLSYHLFEIYLEKGRWIPIDGGTIGFPDGRTAEVFVGAGRNMVVKEKFYWTSELYFDKEVGEKTSGGAYLQPWNLMGGSVTKQIKWQAVAFPYIPLNKVGRFQLVVERIQATVDTKFGKVGGGFSGYKFGGSEFQPRLLATWTPPKSPIEIRYDLRLPHGQQRDVIHVFQLRLFVKTKLGR